MRQKELMIYRNMEDGELLRDMAWLMSCYNMQPLRQEDMPFSQGREKPGDREGMRELFYDCIHRLIELAGRYGFHGNLWHCYLTNLLVNNENSYSCGCEIRGEIEGTINDAALHDIVIFKEFFDYDFTAMGVVLDVKEFSMIQNYVSSSRESKVYNTRICTRICELAEKFCQDNTPEEMKATLTDFYREYGVGKLGLHKSFRVSHDENGVHIDPILNITHVTLDELVGYEIPKKKLTDNTDAFVAGRQTTACCSGMPGRGNPPVSKPLPTNIMEKASAL